MRITYKAIRVVPVSPEHPEGHLEVEFKVNDNDSSNVYIRSIAEAAMLKATGNKKVHGWSPDFNEGLNDRPVPTLIQ